MRRPFAIKLRAPKPRNPILQAAVLGLAKLASRRHQIKTYPARRNSGRELDQIVRECGES